MAFKADSLALNSELNSRSTAAHDSGSSAEVGSVNGN